MNHAQDRVLIERAIEVGRQARYWSAPNPPVGCVLAHGSEVIGTGFTQPAGQAHAEVMALNAAGDAKGATAYVTLEPCSHEGATGPCVTALIAAGISRAVIAVEDPNPQVAGRGMAALRAAGIEVDLGMGAEQVEQDLAGFLLRMRRGHGRITLKLAVSLDGRIAMASGESQWITGEPARRDVQLLRAQSDLIVTGVGTVLADDCRLTLRPDELPLEGEAKTRALAHGPARMVLDSRGRMPADARILEGASTVIVTTEGVKRGDANSPCQLPADPMGRVDLGAWVAYVGEQAHNDILVEAGPTLSGALLQGGWVDQLVLYQAPKILGDSARPMANMSIDVLAEAPEFDIIDVTRLGADLRIMATPGSGRSAS
ncbi:MAG: bifunctional diaminohydroxyphosphoribosylaminopyrimidine deaminase/5-amino-6-(5-phosphoribosylamino)uracil reductase RibD [Luminiphilus sp.]|nr:bifunctional diaminohydroxyphosphoribosylaminopyrimidine deaminase/5-amino-6-(5-phosphoribosylamino)uracil reductase RibD [Luminiphilus sp.]